MSRGGPELRSLPERLLGSALLLLLGAAAVRWAVHLIESVFWPLLGLAALALVSTIAVRLWLSRRGGW